jgi:importin subunit alpha-2
MIYEAPKNRLKPIQVMEDVTFEEEEQQQHDEKHEEENSLDEKMLTLVDACWTLVELSVHHPHILFFLLTTKTATKIEEKKEFDFIHVLVQLLQSTQNSILLTPVLRLVGNFISTDENYSNKLVEANVLSVMPQVLSHTNRSVREEACWMLSNIAGGSHEDLSQVYKMIQTPGLLKALVEQIAWAEYAVKREAAWSICNILVRTKDLHFLVHFLQTNEIVLRSFVPLLEEWDDPMLILVILEAITSILTVFDDQQKEQDTNIKVLLEESGCLDKIEELCYDENEQVSEVAAQIIDTWFQKEEEEQVENDMTLRPPTTNENGQLQFQPINDTNTNVQFNF